MAEATLTKSEKGPAVPMSTSRTSRTTDVTNHGFHGDANEVVKQAIDSTQGFTFVLSGLKAWLEHGIELSLVADKRPDDRVKR